MKRAFMLGLLMLLPASVSGESWIGNQSDDNETEQAIDGSRFLGQVCPGGT